MTAASISSAKRRPYQGLRRESQGPPEADVVRAWHFPDIATSALWVATRAQSMAVPPRSSQVVRDRARVSNDSPDEPKRCRSISILDRVRSLSSSRQVPRHFAGPSGKSRAGMRRSRSPDRAGRGRPAIVARSRQSSASARSRSFGTCRTGCSRSCKRRTVVTRPRTRTARSHGIADDGGSRSGERARCS